MVDGVSFDIPSEAVQDSDILEFKRYGNGERANYKGLIITRDNLSCSVRGSLHKYFNDGKHNYNDFTLSDFINTVSDLEKTLKNNPRNNLKTSIKTRDIGVLNIFDYSVMLREDKRKILSTN